MTACNVNKNNISDKFIGSSLSNITKSINHKTLSQQKQRLSKSLSNSSDITNYIKQLLTKHHHKTKHNLMQNFSFN